MKTIFRLLREPIVIVLGLLILSNMLDFIDSSYFNRHLQYTWDESVAGPCSQAAAVLRIAILVYLFCYCTLRLAPSFDPLLAYYLLLLAFPLAYWVYISFSPMAAGFLSGKYERGKGPIEGARFSLGHLGYRYNEPYWNDQNFSSIEQLKKIAQDHGTQLFQFALAWVLSNPTITSVVCGTTSIKSNSSFVGSLLLLRPNRRDSRIT